MIEQINTYDSNVLELEVIDTFTEADEKFCQKLVQQKMDQGFEQVNMLIKIDEMKISGSSTRAFFEDIIWLLRNYKHLGHLAIVAHSKVLKVLVPIDNLFFERSSKGRHERYFDVSQMDEAMKFVMGE